MQLKNLVEELEKIDTDIYRRVRCVNHDVSLGLVDIKLVPEQSTVHLIVEDLDL